MHKNKNHGFEIEYAVCKTFHKLFSSNVNIIFHQSISAEPVAPGEAAKLPVNRTKNRYANIFACKYEICIKISVILSL